MNYQSYDNQQSPEQNLTFDYTRSYFEDRGICLSEENQLRLGIKNALGRYTNTALFLSEQCCHSIRCVCFEGEEKTKPVVKKEFKGSLLKQMEEAYDYLCDYNVSQKAEESGGLEDGGSKTAYFNYPLYALREALLNGVVHRDYKYSGSNIINIFSNRMEFVSLGGLLEGLTREDMLVGISQTRNPVLAGIFEQLGLIDNYGSGIQRMEEKYRYGKRPPEYIVTPSAVITVLHNRNAPERRGIFGNYHTTEEKVLSLFGHKKEITRKDVEQILECPSIPARRILQGLVCEERIEMVGRSKGAKYVLK